MWGLKIVGMVCVLAGCCCIGWVKTEEYRKRIWMLREMIQSFIIFKSMTETYRMPLHLVFEKISSQVKGPVGEFYEKLALSFQNREQPDSMTLWRRAVEDMADVFNEEDRIRMIRLGNFVGVQDVHTQAAAVEDCIREMRERIGILEAERPGREKLYHILSLTIGGFLVILFI